MHLKVNQFQRLTPLVQQTFARFVALSPILVLFTILIWTICCCMPLLTTAVAFLLVRIWFVTIACWPLFMGDLAKSIFCHSLRELCNYIGEPPSFLVLISLLALISRCFWIFSLLILLPVSLSIISNIIMQSKATEFGHVVEKWLSQELISVMKCKSVGNNEWFGLKMLLKYFG